MKIPKKIEIEIQNQQNEIVEKEILFGIKIFINEDSYLNFSPIKTEKNGRKIISQNQINDFLKENKSLKNFDSNKIEIEIWDFKLIEGIFKSVKKLISITEEKIKLDLISRGFDEKSAKQYSINSYKKLQDDYLFWEPFFQVENKNLKFIESKISDIWEDEKEKKYIFQIK